MNFTSKSPNGDQMEYFMYPQKQPFNRNEKEKLIQDIKNVMILILQEMEVRTWYEDQIRLIYRSEQKDLSSILSEEDSSQGHIYGLFKFENVEDEWFLVYLLFELTKQIEGLVVRVVDNDGEFLLIEAADFLPEWADPEVCDKRVYIYSGSLHIIPVKSKKEHIKIKYAIEMIRTDPNSTLAAPGVQNAIGKRLKDFPNKIKDNFHRANAFLPVNVAALLAQKPNLIEAAAQAFCDRDSLDLKVCRAMKYFPPENRIMTHITFSKYSYVILSHSRYVPELKTGWNLPPPHSKAYKSHILGVKIACGFEILMARATSGEKHCGKSCNDFLSNLKALGYFKGLLEDSKEYARLLNEAEEYYKLYENPTELFPGPPEIISQLMKKEINFEDFNQKGNVNLAEDEDESWMNVTMEELTALMEEKFGVEEKLVIGKNGDASEFTGKLQEFLHHVSDVEGAEFPQEKTKSTDKVKDTYKIDLDANAFASAVQNMLNFAIPEDNWSSDSDMSDYGEEEEEEEIKNDMKLYMEEMDKELAGTTIGESFKRKGNEIIVEDNTLENIIESVSLQMGDAGPSTNLFNPMGVVFDRKSLNKK